MLGKCCFIARSLGIGKAKIGAIQNQSWIWFHANSFCAILSLLIFWVLQLLKHMWFLMLRACNGRDDIKSLCLGSVYDSRDRNNPNESFHPSYKSTSLWLHKKFCFKDVWTTCLVSGLIAVFWREGVHITQLLSLTLVTLLIVIELWNCFIPDGTLIWLLIELSVLAESLSICFGNVYNIIQNLYQIKPP